METSFRNRDLIIRMVPGSWGEGEYVNGACLQIDVGGLCVCLWGGGGLFCGACV